LLLFSRPACGTDLDLGIAVQPPHEHRLIPVLWVGSADSPVARGLSKFGIGVIAVRSVDRALRLLRNFSVAAVIYDAPAGERVSELTATGTPLIVLVADDTDWQRPGVTTFPPTALPEAIAAAVQRCANCAAA
jgi:hypothetical protein